MSRDKQHAIRNALHQIYTQIPAGDRSQIAEWERDLITTANCAVWDKDLKTIYKCVNRLQKSPERREHYKKVMDLLSGSVAQ